MQKGALYVGNNTIDMSSLSEGLYFLNVETGHRSTTKKIVKY